MLDSIIIRNLKIYAYHGVNPEEKRDGQYFYLDMELCLDLSAPCRSDKVEQTVNYDEVCNLAQDVMTRQPFDLIERAAQAVCDEILSAFPAVQRVNLTLKKPDAPVKCEIEYAAVKLCRERGAHPTPMSKAVLGLGGNLGDARQSLVQAAECIDALCGTRLLRQSEFYLSEALEVDEPQPDYVNCAVEIETFLSPHALLGACLGIESALGRVRNGRHSPRTIDIDLLIYENASESSSELVLPHPRMLERAFVLLPLSDLYPDGTALGVRFAESLSALKNDSGELTQRIVKM